MANLEQMKKESVKMRGVIKDLQKNLRKLNSNIRVIEWRAKQVNEKK